MRTKNPSARARIFLRLSTALGAVDVQAELRQLEREISFDARRDDLVDDSQVVAGRGVGFRQARHAFAEVVEGLEEAVALDRPGRLDRFGCRFAGDEPAREARRLSHPVARRQFPENAAPREQVEKSLQCGPSGDGEQVLDGPGVVAQHAAIAHAEPSAFRDDDPARLERLGGFLNRLAAARHAEVGALDRTAPRSVDRSVLPDRAA